MCGLQEVKNHWGKNKSHTSEEAQPVGTQPPTRSSSEAEGKDQGQIRLLNKCH